MGNKSWEHLHICSLMLNSIHYESKNTLLPDELVLLVEETISLCVPSRPFFLGIFRAMPPTILNQQPSLVEPPTKMANPY
ncbi:hypothetical protein HanIR_Chr14g0722261 [Helianthus annuus]|nr:hypothetical protein HanIR_Chr14g0722261 [Helianthus annuus]